MMEFGSGSADHCTLGIVSARNSYMTVARWGIYAVLDRSALCGFRPHPPISHCRIPRWSGRWRRRRTSTHFCWILSHLYRFEKIEKVSRGFGLLCSPRCSHGKQTWVLYQAWYRGLVSLQRAQVWWHWYSTRFGRVRAWGWSWTTCIFLDLGWVPIWRTRLLDGPGPAAAVVRQMVKQFCERFWRHRHTEGSRYWLRAVNHLWTMRTVAEPGENLREHQTEQSSILTFCRSLWVNINYVTYVTYNYVT